MPELPDTACFTLARVRALQATPLGIVLGETLRRTGDPESPLGNLFADAFRDAMPGADVALNSNSRGGLRADLPAGALTFGRLYEAFPFDNRLVTLTLKEGNREVTRSASYIVAKLPEGWSITGGVN